MTAADVCLNHKECKVALKGIIKCEDKETTKISGVLQV